MIFHPDGSKKARGTIFGKKSKKKTHPPLVFNNSNIYHDKSQKHPGVTLDFKSTFNEHLYNALHEIIITIGLLCRLQNSLPRKDLISIYKAFDRPHLDYGDFLYD